MPLRPTARAAGGTKRFSRWWSALSRLLFIVITAEVGSVLLVFPWLDLWGQNLFSGGSPDWYAVWMNPYFRGGISGVGAVNLCISLVEVIRFRRPARDRALSIQ